MVLTSHSMEECEALCHRAGIMVAGKLRCLGPIQRLKSEHGAGYSLDLRVGGDGAIDTVRGLIERRVPDATLKEECATRLRYGLPSSAVASVFALLEDKSNEGLVQDYQLGQTTLEEVFLRFAEGVRRTNKASVGGDGKRLMRCCSPSSQPARYLSTTNPAFGPF